MYAGAVICLGGLIFAGIRMMSGRFQDLIPGLFGALFGAECSVGEPVGSDLAPEDDIAPGSIQPVVAINQDGARQIELMRWGLKLPDRLLFNARSEGIEGSKFWKDSFEERRIVPASAFIEWQQVPKGQKKPKYEIGVSGRDIIGFAGLWAPWKNQKTEQWEDTFSVFTTDPNAKMLMS